LPKAMLPASLRVVLQAVDGEKSSDRISAPGSGSSAGVGVVSGVDVGSTVAVAVMGNQLMVVVGGRVGGTGVGVPVGVTVAGWQAPSSKPNNTGSSQSRPAGKRVGREQSGFMLKIIPQRPGRTGSDWLGDAAARAMMI